jgi:hypothetical protein
VRSISEEETTDAAMPDATVENEKRVGADQRGWTGESLSQAAIENPAQTAIRSFR